MSEQFKNLVEFAIRQEQAAAELYEKYAVLVNSRSAKIILESMAAMEQGHEARLKKMLEEEENFLPKPGSVDDVHISDFVVAPTLTENSDIQDVFIFAIKSEEMAANLYTKLAEVQASEEGQELFRSLAEEEKKHKFDLETEYESAFMSEN